MALYKETTISRWNCDAFDELPSTAPEGSTAHMIPTGEVFIFHDDTWVLDLRLVNAIKQAELAVI